MFAEDSSHFRRRGTRNPTEQRAGAREAEETFLFGPEKRVAINPSERRAIEGSKNKSPPLARVLQSRGRVYCRWGGGENSQEEFTAGETPGSDL